MSFKYSGKVRDSYERELRWAYDRYAHLVATFNQLEPRDSDLIDVTIVEMKCVNERIKFLRQALRKST